MQLTAPVEITSRLLPGVKIGEHDYVAIEYAGRGENGRNRFRWHIDASGHRHFTGNKLECHGGLQAGLENLLAFLVACGEDTPSGEYKGGVHFGENHKLFCKGVACWASRNKDELHEIQCQLEETPGLIVE